METNIKEVLRKYLEITGITQSEFARRAGLDKQTINNYLDNKKTTTPSLRTLQAIFAAHPEFKRYYDEKTDQQVEEPRAEYRQSFDVKEVINELREDIRNMHRKLRMKELMLKILEGMNT